MVSSRISSLNSETTRLKGRKTKAVPIIASGAEAWRLQDRDADGFIDGGRENFERRIDGILRGDEDARG